MDKQQKLKIALPILAVVMFFVWKPVFTGSGHKDKENNITSAGVAQSVLSGSISQSDIALLLNAGKAKKTRTSYEDWGRNPFVLGQNQNTMMVEGIFWDEQNPNVMINGNILGIGEKFGDVTVVDIKPNNVTFKDNKGVFELGPGGSR